MNKRVVGILLAAILLPCGLARAEGLQYKVSWMGNSFSGKDASVLQDVDGICVLPDGTLFTNVFWDEAGGNVQEYKDGAIKAVAGHTHGWGYEGGGAIAANARYLFIVENVDNEGGGLKGDSWPAKGFTWSGISRRPRGDIRTAAPLAGGHGKEGDVLQGSFLMVTTIPEGQSGAVRGACADETHLFVSSPFDDSIKSYAPETMALVKSWTVDRPDKICLDKKGNVWALQEPAAGGNWKAICFTAQGDLLPTHIDFPAGVSPAAVGVDRQNRLLVADDGPDQQIKIYGPMDGTPRLQATFGSKGGILARPAGRFGDGRFNMPKGVGADAAGNLYVASSGSAAGGGAVLECYGPDGHLRWRRFGLTFVDMADADPASMTDIYTKEEHFVMDYARPPGEEWSYRGYTLDRFKYPDDPRLHTGPTNAWVRRIGGRPFLFVTDMTAEYLSVYRFNPAAGGIAIPCVLFAKRHAGGATPYPPHQPDKGEWIWTDHNGNGQMDEGEFQSNGGANSQGIMIPDDKGTIWQVNGNGIRAMPAGPLDKNGIPTWDYAHTRLYPKPTEFDEIRRLRYLPSSDVMLLGGNKGENRNQHWKPMGPVLCRYDGWSKGTPRLRQQIILPFEKGSSGHESVEPISFDVVGDYVFVAYTRGLKAEGLKNAFVKVLRLKDLSVVGNLSAETALGDTGLLDLVESTRALRRPDGTYMVFLEDDYRAKIVVFQWKPV